MIDFNKLIDAHLARETSAKKLGRYYPSEIAGCMRKTWYSYTKPKKLDKKLMRVFYTGDLLHEFIADVIRSDKNPEVELLREEFPIKIQEKDFLISGRIDDIILVKMDNKEVLLEVKSCKYLPKEFREEHESQLQIYMHATGVHSGFLLYIQKDNLEIKDFPIEYSKEKVNKIMKRFRELHSMLAENKMPEAEARHSEDKSWMCDYCSWKEECWERED